MKGLLEACLERLGSGVIDEESIDVISDRGLSRSWRRALEGFDDLAEGLIETEYHEHPVLVAVAASRAARYRQVSKRSGLFSMEAERGRLAGRPCLRIRSPPCKEPA
jgi:hypothetical protein